MSAAILASKNRIAPCQSMVFSDKNLKSFLSRYYTPLGRKMWPNKRMKFSIRTCTHNQRMPDARGFFQAGKAILGRHTAVWLCLSAHKMRCAPSMKPCRSVKKKHWLLFKCVDYKNSYQKARSRSFFASLRR